MKVRIRKEDGRLGFRKVSSAADKRGSIPILSGVLIGAEDGTLTLTATNLEIGISVTLPCEVIEPGETVVNALKMAKLFSTITGEEVELEFSEDKLTVKSSNSRFSLATMRVDEFPDVEIPDTFDVNLPSSVLEKALKKVAYAVGRDEARYVLTGVLLKSFGDRLHVVATDGHRLAVYEVEVGSAEFSAIIPRKSISELRKILREGDTVEFLNKENKVYLRVGDVVLWTSVIEGEYPDYLSVIPENNPISCRADRNELLSALKEVASIYDKEEVRAVVLSLSPDTLVLRSRRSDSGTLFEEAEVRIPVECSGEEFEIGFNVNHLIESVSSFDGDTITITMEQPVTPALIFSEEERELKNVIMPVKL